MRICSLLPSGTEILFDLGLGDQIIGVSDLCQYPPEARTKQTVSRSKIDPSILSSQEVDELMHRLLASGESPYELDQEWLLREAPDIILTQDLCYYCEVDAASVEEAVRPIPVAPQVLVLQPRTLDGILASIDEVGQACCAVREAAELVQRLKERFGAIERALSNVSRRPKVLSLEGINPLVFGGHWIPDLLNLAGGSAKLYPPGSPATRLTWQDVKTYAPEKLFVDLCSSDLERSLREIPWLVAHDGWEELPAVRDGEVYVIDHVYFSNPGPRVVQGAEILAELTHPALFSGLIPCNSVLKLDAGLAATCPVEDIASCFQPYPH